MNSYQRLYARLAGEPVDKIPNLSIVMAFAADQASINYKNFCLEPKSKVEANLLCRDRFGLDIVTVMSDPYGEAMDSGIEVFFPDNGNPVQKTYMFEDGILSADKIPMWNLETGPRMSERVETIKLYAQAIKRQCPIAGWVEGAAAEFCDLRGLSAAIIDFATDTLGLYEILEKLTAQAIYYANAQIDAGADIIGVGDAVCSVLGRNVYRKYIYETQKRIIDAIHERGALVKLHICGDITYLLEDIVELNPDILDIDFMVDFKTAATMMQGHGLVSGNLHPVAVLMNGSEEMVINETMQCILEGGQNCCISGGCETPAATPEQNLLALNACLYL